MMEVLYGLMVVFAIKPQGYLEPSQASVLEYFGKIDFDVRCLAKLKMHICEFYFPKLWNKSNVSLSEIKFTKRS